MKKLKKKNTACNMVSIQTSRLLEVSLGHHSATTLIYWVKDLQGLTL